MTWPAYTERLAIRPIDAGDLDDLWAYRRLEPVNRWLSGRSVDRDDFAAKILTPEHLDKTLVVELDGVVIGDLQLDVVDAWAQAEVADQAKRTQGQLGWCFNPDHTGRGYATEAVRELIRIAFDELGLRRLEAECFAVNEPSWRLMERVGMRREAYTVGESLHRSGVWHDGMMYALLANERETATRH
nr:GNAT family protein [Spelaeicoccus albus]